MSSSCYLGIGNKVVRRNVVADAFRQCGRRLPSTRGRVIVCAQSKHGVQRKVLSEDSKAARQNAASVVLLLTGFACTPNPAIALTAEDVTNAFSQAQELAKQAQGAASTSYSYAKTFLDQFVEVAKPAVETASPYVQEYGQKAIDVAVPVASELAGQAQKLAGQAGIDTNPFVDAAKTAVQAASSATGFAASQANRVLGAGKPYAASALDRILAQEPNALALEAGGLILLYLLAPFIFSSIGYTFRGYAGDYTAAQALDVLSTQDFVLIDVRTEKEKSKSGLPSLPRSAKNKLISLPVEELPSRLRGQLRSAKRVEAELTAIKITALKKITKSSKVIVLDAYGGVAKTIAKFLKAYGFRNAYIVRDGFDGGKGWLQSQLGVENATASRTEILSPSRIISAGSRALGGAGARSSDVVDVGTRRGLFLPSGSDD